MQMAILPMFSNLHCAEAMHGLTQKTLFRTPILFTKNSGTAITIPQVYSHSLYTIMRSAHAPSGAKGNNQKEPPSSSEADTGEDMADSFGVAYATRSSEEGYGERYRENEDEEDTIPVQRGATTDSNAVVDVCREKDKSQGSEIKEKEEGRHATEESAFPAHDRPLQRGAGGVSS